MNQSRALLLGSLVAMIVAGISCGRLVLADGPKGPDGPAKTVQIGKGTYDSRSQLGRALIHVAGDEYVLACSAAGQAGLRVTTDGGEHWSEMMPLGPGDVVNAALGGKAVTQPELYVVYSHWLGGVPLAEAEKRGAAVRFRKLTRVGPGKWDVGDERTVPGSHYAGSVAVEPTGRVWVTYCRINDRGYESLHGGGNIKACSTIDGGRTWSPVIFAHLTGSGDGSVKHAIMEWQGRPTVVWSFWDVGGMSWGYWDGSMWTKLRDVSPLLSPGHTYSACEDGRGRLHVAFNHYRKHLYHMFYDGAKWTRPVRIHEGDLGEAIPCLGSDGDRVWCV